MVNRTVVGVGVRSKCLLRNNGVCVGCSSVQAGEVVFVDIFSNRWRMGIDRGRMHFDRALVHLVGHKQLLVVVQRRIDVNWQVDISGQVKLNHVVDLLKHRRFDLDILDEDVWLGPDIVGKHYFGNDLDDLVGTRQSGGGILYQHGLGIFQVQYVGQKETY